MEPDGRHPGDGWVEHCMGDPSKCPRVLSSALSWRCGSALTVDSAAELLLDQQLDDDDEIFWPAADC